MATSWPLTLTVASGDALPVTGSSAELTTLLSSRDKTRKKSCLG